MTETEIKAATKELEDYVKTAKSTTSKFNVGIAKTLLLIVKILVRILDAQEA